MHSRALGNTGIEVSEFGLGAWQLGERSWNGPGEEESLRIVDAALALGCTFIDTAPAYGGGRSEELLGQALEGRRDRVVVCTKFGYWPDLNADFGPERIEESVEASLRRLRTDYLDVLLIHSPPDPTVLDASAPQYATLERLKSEGVVRAYGVSLTDDSSAELERVLETPSEVVEVRFNALHQEPLAGMEHARDQGLGVIVKVPLESGWLSGRYGAQSTFDDVRGRWTREEITRRARLVQGFERVLPEGTPPARGALRFILAHSAVSTVAPGAKSIGQLHENMAAAEGSLPSSVVAAIHDLWERELRDEPLAW